MKLRFLLFFIFAFSSVPFPVKALSQCLSQNQLQEVFAEYQFLHWDETLKNYKQYLVTDIDSCDSNTNVFKIIDAILLLKKILPQPEIEGQFQSLVAKEGANKFFHQRISRILFETKAHESACPENALAYHVPHIDKEMHICPEFKNYIHSEYLAAYTLLHEARHVDIFPHVACTHGYAMKSDAQPMSAGSCDFSYENQGSYGVGAAFLEQIYQTTDNEALRQETRSHFIVDLITHFNQMPLQIKQGILLQKEDGTISFYDGIEHQLSKQPGLQVMALRNVFPAFFNQSGSVKSYMDSKFLVETPGGFAELYRKGWSDNRGTLMDVFFGESEQLSCLLFEHLIECGGKFGETFKIPLHQIKPQRLVQDLSNFWEPNPALQILDSNGRVHPLPKTFQKLSQITELDLLPAAPRDLWDTSLLSRADLENDSSYAVTTSGELVYKANSLVEDWTPVKAFKGQKFVKVLPYFWSQQLEDL